jgi:hypothetical protein
MPARLTDVLSAVVTRHPLRALALVVAVLAGVGVLAAVRPDSGAEASGGRATVTGLVVRSAPCPVARAERSCPAHPVAGADVSLWRDGRVVAETQTDEHGRFRLSGREGAAEIRASRAFGGYVARTTRAVTLRRTTPADVRLLLDNGIR